MNRLKLLREERGFSLQDLSDKLNEEFNIKIGRASLNNYERGTQSPKQEIWDALAKTFHVTVPYIMGLSPARNKLENKRFEKGISDLVDLVNENNENAHIIRESISLFSAIIKENKDNAELLESFIKIINNLGVLMLFGSEMFEFDDDGNQLSYNEMFREVFRYARDIYTDVDTLVEFTITHLPAEREVYFNLDLKEFFNDEEIENIHKEYSFEDFEKDEEKRKELIKLIENRITENFKKINQERNDENF